MFVGGGWGGGTVLKISGMGQESSAGVLIKEQQIKGCLKVSGPGTTGIKSLNIDSFFYKTIIPLKTSDK